MASDEVTLKLVLFHITSQDLVDDALALGFYHCPSLAEEGFIHCCQLEQLSGVIDRYYADDPDLCLLVIERDLLSAPVKFENTVGGDELFPHVYGPINITAVSKIKNGSSATLRRMTVKESIG